jgi:hypothetical protein
MEDVEKIIEDAKEHDHDAGVSSLPEEDTHQLDFDDYEAEDLYPSDDSLKAEEDTDSEGELLEIEPEAEDQPPFHEHPRWQKLLAERDDLQGKLETLEGDVEGYRTLEDRINQRFQLYERELDRYRFMPEHTVPQEQPDPFATIMDKEDSEIVEQFQEDPKGFLTGFGESIQSQVMRSVDERNIVAETDKALQYGLEHFAEQHEDFMPLVESGEVAHFIQMNPIHNAISAYWAIRESRDQGGSDHEREALEQQIREDERNKTLASIRAKQGAEVLDGSSSVTPVGSGSAVEPELQDTARHGGKRSVIASRLKRFRERLG